MSCMDQSSEVLMHGLLWSRICFDTSCVACKLRHASQSLSPCSAVFAFLISVHLLCLPFPIPQMLLHQCVVKPRTQYPLHRCVNITCDACRFLGLVEQHACYLGNKRGIHVSCPVCTHERIQEVLSDHAPLVRGLSRVREVHPRSEEVVQSARIGPMISIL